MHIKNIYAAQERLKLFLPKTPLLYSYLLQHTLNKKVWLKLETQLPTGSFKPRPAFNSILTQLDIAKEKGVIASSSGNFAQGVAYAARTLSVNAMIVMTETTSPYKIERTKNLGAEVRLCGPSHQERLEATLQLQQETGRLLLHPYDSNETIAADGTIGLELSEQLGEKLDNNMTILVPVSGGGLLAGISFALKTLHPSCHVIGVQPKANSSLAQSLQAGKCTLVNPFKTIADALIASSPGEKPFKIIRELVDEVILVEEEEIEIATRFMIEQHKLVVEPGGAVTIAALLAKKITADHLVCVISGGNIKLWEK